MPIIKVKKKRSPYVILDKTFINDQTLSLKSKGLLAYLLSLPVDWKVHVSELTKHFTDGKHAIYSALKELKCSGYVTHFRYRNEQGTYANAEYHVFEMPQPHSENQEVDKTPDSGFQDVAHPYTENSDMDNPPVINNKNNKYKNNKITTATNIVNLSDHAAPIEVPAVHNQVVAAENGKSSDALLPKTGFIENYIDQTLTKAQQRCVHRLVPGLLSYFPAIDPEALEAGIVHTLCDTEAYTKSGRDFFKKLNTIHKAIRMGRWQIPVAITESEEAQKKQHARDWMMRYQELQGEIAQLSELLKAMESQGKTDLSEQLREQREQSKCALAALEQENPGLTGAA